jgi:hypothetical protein
MMEAFRPPAGSQKKRFSWTVWLIPRISHLIYP